MSGVDVAGGIRSGRVIEVLAQLVLAITREYDSLGRVINETARGQVVSREYDDVAGFEDLAGALLRKTEVTEFLERNPLRTSGTDRSDQSTKAWAVNSGPLSTRAGA